MREIGPKPDPEDFTSGILNELSAQESAFWGIAAKLPLELDIIKRGIESGRILEDVASDALGHSFFAKLTADLLEQSSGPVPYSSWKHAALEQMRLYAASDPMTRDAEFRVLPDEAPRDISAIIKLYETARIDSTTTIDAMCSPNGYRDLVEKFPAEFQ